MKDRKFSLWILCLCVTWLLPAPLGAEPVCGLSAGQTVYVPAYAHIYGGHRERPFLLTMTLSIRNVEPRHPIRITRIDFYETHNERFNPHLDSILELNPWKSTRFVVAEKKEGAGSGAHFIVVWEASRPVNPPLVEAIMIGTQSQQGISFSSRGQAIIPVE